MKINGRLLKISQPLPLAVICVLMFGFCFLLVPLYSVFCDWTGINGKTSGPYQSKGNEEIILERKVAVQFVSNSNENVSWPFKALEDRVDVHIGEKRQVEFNVNNVTDAMVVAQAVPSVSPSEAAPYLHKIECFCFQQQVLAAGESKNMPLVFFIDPKLPKHITKLTLSYTLFDVTPVVDTTI